MHDRAERACPFCGESILAAARKCKHCKRWIPDEEIAPVSPPAASAAEADLPTRPREHWPLVLVVLLVVASVAAFWVRRDRWGTAGDVAAPPVADAPAAGGIAPEELLLTDPLPRSSPERGSPLRQALMDAMRPRLERIMGAPVLIMVRVLEVQGHSAFFVGHPVHADGRPFTEAEQERAFEGMVHDGADPTMAWLVRTKSGWAVQSLLINQSDVGWLGWCDDREMRSLMSGYCAEFGR